MRSTEVFIMSILYTSGRRGNVRSHFRTPPLLYHRGVASNEAEEAVASLFCAKTRARIGAII